MEGTSNIILATLNELFNSLFSSIDSSIYSALDEIAFINSDIIGSSYLEKILGEPANTGILVIANALLIGFLLFYATKYMLSSFAITEVQSPYKFVLKLILIAICLNSSFFICEQIVNLNAMFSEAIREVGKDILHTDISFSNVITCSGVIAFVEEKVSNFFSIDGIIKTIMSAGSLIIAFTYAIRYVLVKVFILLSPFAVLTLSTRSTSNIFKSWLKCFVSLLFTELFASVLLIVMFSINYSPDNIISKLLFIGSLLALMKVNNYVREFIGGVSIDVYNSIYGLRNMSRHM